MSTLIATFDDKEPAGALADRLGHAGIKARVGNDFFLQTLVFLARPSATRKVYVEDAQFEAARDLVEAWGRQEHVLDDAVRCPECHSPRVEFPQFTRKFVTPLLVELLISLGFGEMDYYCLDCLYTWPRKMKVQPELDVLGFPKRVRGKQSAPGAKKSV